MVLSLDGPPTGWESSNRRGSPRHSGVGINRASDSGVALHLVVDGLTVIAGTVAEVNKNLFTLDLAGYLAQRFAGALDTKRVDAEVFQSIGSCISDEEVGVDLLVVESLSIKDLSELFLIHIGLRLKRLEGDTKCWSVVLTDFDVLAGTVHDTEVCSNGECFWWFDCVYWFVEDTFKGGHVVFPYDLIVRKKSASPVSMGRVGAILKEAGFLRSTSAVGTV